MARKLSIRSRGQGAFEVGPTAHGSTVMVVAKDRHDALEKGKAKLRSIGKFGDADLKSFRFTPEKIDTRRRRCVSATVDSR